MIANPTAPLRMIRITGVIRLFSNAYLTKKTTPRKKAKPPIQANNLTPTKDSQLMGGTGTGAGLTIGGGCDPTGVAGGDVGSFSQLGKGGGIGGAGVGGAAGGVGAARRSRSRWSMRERRLPFWASAMIASTRATNASRPGRIISDELPNDRLLIRVRFHNPVGQ